MDVDMRRITHYFDDFRKASVEVDDEILERVFAQHDLRSHEYCKDFPKESLRSMLSTIANEQSCKLTSDQEDDIMKALCHHSLHGKIQPDMWKTCLKYWMRKDISSKSALLIVDVQNDFITGTLALKNQPAKQDGEEVVQVINKLKNEVPFDLKVFTLDWHPSNHCSYHVNANMYPIHQSSKIKAEDAKMYDTIIYDGNVQLEQILWPIHCEQGSWGAKLHDELKVIDKDLLIYKGSVPHVDSYSAFWDNGKLSQTNLFQTLLEHSITQTFVCGLATDFCVLFSAVDSAEHGFKTYCIEDASRGVADNSISAAKQKMIDAGVTIITVDKVTAFI